MFPDASILEAIGQAVWRASWQGAALAVAVLAVLVLLRGRVSPAWRYAVWSLVLIRLLFPLVPQARWSAYTLVEAWGEQAASGSSDPVTPHGVAPRPGADGRPTTASARPRPPSIDVRRVAASVWLAGVVAMAIGLGCRARQLRRIANTWPEVADRRVLELMAECKGRLRLRRRVGLCVAPDDTGPAVLGVWRPRIVLPAAILEGFGRDRLEAVLLHELAHIRRHDIAVHWLMIAARVLHWFNPMAWLALSQLVAERELACDDVVIDVLGPSSRRLYGETMLRLLERLLVRPAVPGVVQFFGPRRRLWARLESLTRPRGFERRARPIPFVLLLALVIFGLCDSVRSRGPRAEHQGSVSPPAATQARDRASGSSSDLEAKLYKALQKDHEFNDPHCPFLIKVRDVRNRTLIDATFKHRVNGKDEFDLVIQARRAELRIDPGSNAARVTFDRSVVQHFRRDDDIILIDDHVLVIPLPVERGIDAGK